MPKKKYILLVLSALIFPLTSFSYYFFTTSWNSKWSYLSAMAVYWIFIIVSILIVTNRQFGIVKTILRRRHKPRWVISYNLLALTPIAGVFIVAFLPNVGELTLINFLIIFLISSINGMVEEVFWRGLYLIHFRNNTNPGILLSTFLFTLWHISLLLLNGINYQGGAIALIGGAFFMGIIWSFVSQKTGSIFYTVLAHVLVNIFAFTGLFVGNNF